MRHLLSILVLGMTITARAGDLADAVLASPAVEAAEQRWIAATHRITSSALLPDPQLDGMVARKSTPEDDNPMWSVGLVQPLPKAGERGALRSRAEAAARMSEADLLMVAGEVAENAAMQIAETEAARARAVTITNTIAHLGVALSALDARIASGRGRTAERLALQTAIADMQLMATREAQMAADAEHAARTLLAWSTDLPLPDFASPDPASLAPSNTPAALLADARAMEADAMKTMARAARRPMTAVGVSFEREEMSDGDEDTVGVSLMTELPWRARRGAAADLAAAQADREASEADRDTASRDLALALARVERAAAYAAEARRIADETGARLSLERDSALQDIGSGGMGGDMSAMVIANLLEREAAVERQRIDANLAERLARASLWRFAPPQPDVKENQP